MSLDTVLIGATGACVLAVIILFVLLLRLGRAHRDLARRYERVVAGAESDGLPQYVFAHLGALEKNQQELERLRAEMAFVRSELQGALKRVGLVRYNPFDDMGGDYSVALALADDTGSGIVFSSLHGRNATRVYVRALSDWASSNPLSAEEEQAVRIAREGGAPSEQGTGA